MIPTSLSLNISQYKSYPEKPQKTTKPSQESQSFQHYLRARKTKPHLKTPQKQTNRQNLSKYRTLKLYNLTGNPLLVYSLLANPNHIANQESG